MILSFRIGYRIGKGDPEPTPPIPVNISLPKLPKIKSRSEREKERQEREDFETSLYNIENYDCTELSQKEFTRKG